MVVGVLVLLGTLGADAGLSQALGWIWPLLIVAFGLWLVWDAGRRRRTSPPAGWDASEPPAGGWGPAASPWAAAPNGQGQAGDGSAPAWGTPGAPGSAWAPGAPGSAWASGAPGSAWAPGAIRERRFLGEIEMAGPFQAGPMDIETFIGEVRLDLTGASFPEGETRIHVGAAIGEVRVLLPSDIPAAVHTSTLLGESEALGRVSGAFMGDTRAETDDFQGATRRIRLEAHSLIGEVAVRRARPEGAEAYAPPAGAYADARPTAPYAPPSGAWPAPERPTGTEASPPAQAPDAAPQPTQAAWPSGPAGPAV